MEEINIAVNICRMRLISPDKSNSGEFIDAKTDEDKYITVLYSLCERNDQKTRIAGDNGRSRRKKYTVRSPARKAGRGTKPLIIHQSDPNVSEPTNSHFLLADGRGQKFIMNRS